MSNGWMVSGYSTGAAVLAEKARNSPQQMLRLRGFWVAPGSSVASTVPFTLRQGESSGATLSSSPIIPAGGTQSLNVHHLDIRNGYFAIAAGTTDAEGAVGGIYGDYG